MSKLKFVTLVGTRPEIIRLSRLIPLLDEAFDHTLIHSGQNYHSQLSDVFFRELEIREPDVYLGVETSSLGLQLASLMAKIEDSIAALKPDGILVLGDTNTALGALVARRMNVAVYHLEAGNRSFDENVPEEVNRRVVDHFAHFNMAYSEAARLNLVREGLNPRFIFRVGSPLREVVDFYLHRIDSSEVLEKLELEPENFSLVSAHRQENVNQPDRLDLFLEWLERFSESDGRPIVVSLHPRTKSALPSGSVERFGPRVIWSEPFGFFDYCKLQRNAALVLSDSGSLSEEAAVMGFRAVSIRDSMERPEALESAISPLGGIQRGVLDDLIAFKRKMPLGEVPDDYNIRNFSQRVIELIFSTLPRYREWMGVR